MADHGMDPQEQPATGQPGAPFHQGGRQPAPDGARPGPMHRIEFRAKKVMMRKIDSVENEAMIVVLTAIVLALLSWERVVRLTE
ncbi:MAG: hypothetical protein HIU89_05805 [Proteobacteria bacterium]|nr:hypothetical protein [Pseudomonadota bacterium]